MRLIRTTSEHADRWSNILNAKKLELQTEAASGITVQRSGGFTKWKHNAGMVDFFVCSLWHFKFPKVI